MPPTYLAGYDGSRESRAAVELAARLGEPAGAQLIAVAVYPHPTATYWLGVDPFSYEDLNRDLRREAQERLDELDVPGVERRAVQADSPARGLHDLAAATHAELIAVGATHHGPFGRLAPGSVGMRLLHGTPCPVAVAPADSADGEIRTVGVAYDGRSESLAALDEADALARRLDARVLVIGAIEPVMAPIGVGAMYSTGLADEVERSFRAALDRAAAGLRAPAEAHAIVGPAASALGEAAADVDLLVTGSRGYGPVGSVLLGSVSRHLVDHAPCPVLVVPRTA